MNIAVTGDKGFIGTHLVNLLKKKNELNLFCFDRSKYNLFDPPSLKEFVSDKDVIIHLAGVNRDSDTAIIAGSICTTYNLILAMKKVKSKARVIFASSIQAETKSVYGLSKRLAEIMLKDLPEELKAPVTVLRMANVFGEGCRPFYNSVVATFCHQVAHSEEISIIEDRRVNFIYVGDVVKGIFSEIMEKGNKFYIKRLSSENILLVSELAEAIRSFEHLDKEPKFESKFHNNLYTTYLSYKDRDR
ncbi:MAG: NAD-dependent epimerase/dehydratase family protein [Nanoarchaeota archaeon]|nr:NAD-dependent epimerase/dehydratase family protein [Nanoarchaeota archaeon]